MCFIFSFAPTTFWVVVGYFVLFSSTKAEGKVQKFGKGLAIWIFVLAAMIPAMGAYMTLSGLCPLTEIFQWMR
ncbi:hypothetical protein ACFLZI_03615 [Nitrospirota bacterium]